MSIALTTAQVAVPDLVAIRAELEATRAAYHQLLAAIPDADLDRPCAVSRWTVKEVMAHLLIAVETAIPMMVGRARKSRPMPRFFDSRLGNWLNYRMAVSLARKCDRADLARRYDAAHERLLTLLSEVRDHEWPLPTALPDGTPRTMETVFRQPTHHFALHSAWVRETLGR
jgi:hypothetical protein